MTGRDKLEARLANREILVVTLRDLDRRGNRYAKTYLEVIEDEIRWLKWMLED